MTEAGPILSPEFIGALDATIALLTRVRSEVASWSVSSLSEARTDASNAAASQLLEFLAAHMVDATDWYRSSCAIAQCAPSTPLALASQVIVAMLAPNLMRADYAGGFGRVDAELTGTLSEYLQVGRRVGVSVYSGTAALYHSLLAAIREAEGKGVQRGDMLILASNEAHSSLEKLGMLCDLSRGCVLRVSPTRLAVSPELIESGGADRRHVIAIIGTVGSTDTGQVDDFSIWNDIAMSRQAGGDVCRVICDAVLSWPLLAVSSNDLDSLEGIVSSEERASLASVIDFLAPTRNSDFMAVDFHKWLGVPLGSAHVLVDADGLTQYLAPFGGKAAVTAEQWLQAFPHEALVDTTRSAVGPVAALLNLRLLSRQGLAGLALHGLVLARRTARLVQTTEWDAIPSEPQGPIACLIPRRAAYAREMCDRAANEIARRGGPLGSVRRLDTGAQTGSWVLRFCFVHPTTALGAVAIVEEVLREIS
jgi:glutamate/tyrosine decarboxylase-like PLP-dependent enzyme